MKGRRRPDTRRDRLPRGRILAGDYWKVLESGTGKPAIIDDEPTNLERTEWMVVAPMPSGGFAIGRLTKHTVRELDDGTISVRPGDGSSNSILITGSNSQQYHGYIERGIWTACA